MSTRTLITQGDYPALNAALAERLFPVREASAPVYIDVDDDVLMGALTDAGLPAADPRVAFLAIVRPTLGPASGQSFLKDHGRASQDWRAHGLPEREPPSCIAALVALCLAAEDMASSDMYSSANYYGRLAAVVGVASEGSPLAALQRDFRENQPALWKALEEWLVACGDRGAPSAQSAGGHRHVGLPMSQALIRDADRPWLYSCFAASGLDAGEAFPNAAFDERLDEWIARGATGHVGALAKRSEAREHLVAAIANEFLAWDGPETGARTPASNRTENAGHPDRPGGTGGSAGALQISADVRGGLQPCMSIILFVDGVDAPVGLAASVGETDVTPIFDVAPTVRDGQFEIAASADADTAGVLLELAEVQDDVGKRWVRTPLDVLVLVEDRDLCVFAEARGITSGERAVILVRSERADNLEVGLADSADPGWERREAGSIKGLPEGWVLFSDVILRRPLPALGDDFGYLSVADKTTIRVTGISLHGTGERTFLQGAPIVVDADSTAPIACIRGGVVSGSDTIDEIDLFVSTAPSASARAVLEGIDVGRWTVRALDAEGAVIARTSFTVAGPGPAVGDAPSAFRELLDPWSTVSAVSGVPVAGEGVFLQGGCVSVQGGAAPGAPQVVSHGLSTNPAGCQWQGVPAPRAEVDFTSLLAYVSAANHGSYASLVEQTKRLADGSAITASEAIAMLSDLGHIEVVLQPTTCQRVAWSIAPPVLVVNGTEAFLAGWRSEALLHALGQWTTRRGGRLASRLHCEGQEWGPDRVRLSGLNVGHAELCRAAALLPGSVAVVSSLDAVANQLRPLSAVRAALPVVRLPGRVRLERYSPKLSKWHPVAGLDKEGAYRWKGRSRYWHWNGSDLRAGSPQLVRWLAASAAERGYSLVGWSSSRRALRFRRHEHPPSLISRLLVLSGGGVVPFVDAGSSPGFSIVEYPNVPAHVLAHVLTALELR